MRNDLCHLVSKFVQKVKEGYMGCFGQIKVCFEKIRKAEFHY